MGLNPNVLSLRDLTLTHYDSPEDILRRVRERANAGGGAGGGGGGTGQSPPGSSASSMVGARVGPPRHGLAFVPPDQSSFVAHEGTRAQQQRLHAMHDENEQLRKKVRSSRSHPYQPAFSHTSHFMTDT